jgi:hypothetical protein
MLHLLHFLFDTNVLRIYSIAFLIGMFGSVGYGSFYQLLALLPRHNLVWQHAKSVDLSTELHRA